jgi:hypothetical protein
LTPDETAWAYVEEAIQNFEESLLRGVDEVPIRSPE